MTVEVHRRIAISTGGGDAPGLNAVIRAATLSAISRGWEVVGVSRGLAGIIDEDDVIPLTRSRVGGIAHLGGTILRASRDNPFRWPQRQPDGATVEVDRSGELREKFERRGIDALIAIGGDGTLTAAHKLVEMGLRVVGVPKTIDNDVSGTLTTFGFDTAVQTAIDAIDKLHTTAESHDRVIVMEVMGRRAGFIALHAGVAATADVILIPEIPYDVGKVCEKIAARGRAGRHFSIVVVAEGAQPLSGGNGDGAPAARLGGIAEPLAHELQRRTGKETRSLTLGHLQRGGMPTGYDRLLASRFGAAAVRAVAEERWGHMVALAPPDIITVPIADVLREKKRVDPAHDLVCTARSTGISFGD